MNITRISKLSELVTNDLKRKPTVVIEPSRERTFNVVGVANRINMSVDTEEWTISENLKQFIEEISKNDLYNNEESILKIYKKICEDYTYDDNVLSYISKNDDDTFFLPDGYGRATDDSWKEKRQEHNRRTCFEISRILAKSIMEFLRISGQSKKYDTCILWDEAVTHYLVGLVCDDYCLSLDLDDFTQIKDLTRIKTGLTLDGIKILDDPYNIFTAILQKFNARRGKIAKEKIEGLIMQQGEKSQDAESHPKDEGDSDDIMFLRNAIQILRKEYDLDPAGIYEYMKEIIDTRLGARARNKVWKEVENNSGEGSRYTRCLIVSINDVQYIIDVTEENPKKIFRTLTEDEKARIDTPGYGIISFRGMKRSWKEEPYDGR